MSGQEWAEYNKKAMAILKRRKRKEGYHRRNQRQRKLKQPAAITRHNKPKTKDVYHRKKQRKQQHEQPTTSIVLSLKTIKLAELVLYLGTGITASLFPRASSVRSWHGFLKAMLRCGKKFQLVSSEQYNHINNLMKDGTNLVQVGDELWKVLTRDSRQGGNYIYDCANEVFEELGNRYHSAGQKLLRTILKLMDYGCLVISANIDDYIERFSERRGQTIQSLLTTDLEKLRQWSNSDEKFAIWHVHGIVSVVESYVLTHQAFKKLLHNKDAMEILFNLYQGKRFLFLGTSLSQEDMTINKLVYKSQLPPRQHFALFRKRDIEGSAAFHAKLLQRNVKSYSFGTRYQDLPGFLERLMKEILRRNS